MRPNLIEFIIRFRPDQARYLRQRARKEDMLLSLSRERAPGWVADSGVTGVLRRLVESEMAREGWTDAETVSQTVEQ